jgi:hypothetical protein
MRTNFPTRWLCPVALVLLLACKKGDDAQPDDPNELITTVNLVFTEPGTTNTQSVSWKDLDGPGGTPPVIGKLTLGPNKTYTMTVQVLDESKSPADNVTAEIEEKKDEHLFVFTPTPASLMSFTPNDKDSRGFPVGLNSTVRTGGVGTGKLQVVLRHQPPVGGKPVKDGTPGPGSSDFDGTFDVEIK